MALNEIRLSPVQDDFMDVVVLAEDGPVRVIAHIDRKVIDEFRPGLTVARRVAWASENLPQIGRLIEQKYAAGQYETFKKGPATAEDTNAVMVIGLSDLRSFDE